MAAKQSQEMRNALRLVAEGLPVRVAAKTAEVRPGSLYGVLQKERESLRAGESLTHAALAKRLTRE